MMKAFAGGWGMSEMDPQENGRRMSFIGHVFHFFYQVYGVRKLPERRTRRPLLSILAACFIAALVVYLVWPVPDLLYAGVKDEVARTNAMSSMRAAIIGSITGLAALAGLLTTSRVYRLSVQGQITDRYSKAIEHLAANDRPELQLGGVYALERLAYDSPFDHRLIVEVLSAFIRERATAEKAQGVLPEVQAAINALGRLPSREGMPRGDLSNAVLRGYQFSRAQWEEVNFAGSRLINCRFVRTNLTRAIFLDAYLEGCAFNFATLTTAQFMGSSVKRCSFDDANLI
jgi:hypothetical protein